MPSRRELREAAEALRRILDAVDRGELDASPELIQRLDSACRTLGALGEPAPFKRKAKGENAEKSPSS